MITLRCFIMLFSWRASAGGRRCKCDTSACMSSGEGGVWNVLEIFVCWNLWVDVRTNPGRAGIYLCRPL